MSKVYVPLAQKGEDGKFYKEFEVPDGLPLGGNVVYVAPPEELLFPRWDASQGRWIEDKDAIIESLKGRINLLDDTILDLMVNVLPLTEGE